MTRRAWVAAVLAACGGGADVTPVALPADPGGLPAEAEFLAQIDRTKGVRDCFEPIRDAELVPASAAARMAPDEAVLGLDLGSVQVAYPVRHLNYHEIVEHRLAGQDLLVCW